jgi:type IV pilus assembly protein PilV
MQEMENRSPAFSQQGVVLLEVLISILIFSMAVLAIVGLQASMVKNTSDAKYRADASYIAQQRIGAMWADPANLGDYLEVDTDISSLLPSGQRTVAELVPGQYQVTITWQAPGEVQHNFTIVAAISGG